MKIIASRFFFAPTACNCPYNDDIITSNFPPLRNHPQFRFHELTALKGSKSMNHDLKSAFA